MSHSLSHIHGATNVAGNTTMWLYQNMLGNMFTNMIYLVVFNTWNVTNSHMSLCFKCKELEMKFRNEKSLEKKKAIARTTYPIIEHRGIGLLRSNFMADEFYVNHLNDYKLK